MKILLATGRYPWPPRRGDQVRSSQYLELLGDRHELHLLAPARPRDAPPPPERWAERVVLYPVSTGWRLLGLVRAVLAGRPLQNGLFWQPALGRELRRRSAEMDVVVLILARLAGHLRDTAGARVVVDFIDSLSLNMSRRARIDAGWRRPFLEVEATRLARCESRLLRTAAGGAVVCERDRRAMAERVPPEVAQRLQVVPMAVAPGGARTETGPAESAPPVLVFTGNLGYFVNEDGLRWWLRDVWPALVERNPELRLVVAGERPSDGSRRAIGRVGGELVVSPPSLRPFLERATLAIAPLRCGSGVPLKILEAWGNGVPVIASSWAAGGTAGREGVELLVADSTEQWIGAVGRLLADPRLRQRLAVAGRSCLEREYGRQTVASALDRWLHEALDRSGRPLA